MRPQPRNAARGGARYGEELDLSLTARIARMTVGIKHARYSAESFGTDVRKLWLSFEYGF